MILNPHRSKLILFEGIDGSGKSEQYNRLKTFMRAYFPDIKIAYTKEPDVNRPTGGTIYQILKGQNSEFKFSEMASYHMQAFYIEDRIEDYRDYTIPNLQNGFHDFKDRGMPSSFCYGSDSSREFHDFLGLHNRVFSAAKVPLIWPDLTLIYDVPAELAIERMKRSGKQLDVFEQKNKLKMVRKNYHDFAKFPEFPNCTIIDGSLSMEEVFIETKRLVLPLLGLSN